MEQLACRFVFVGGNDIEFMFVIPGNFPGAAALGLGFEGVCIVKAKQSPVVSVVQGQAIPDSMRDMGFRGDPKSLEFCPITLIHKENLTIQIQQGGKAFIVLSVSSGSHVELDYHQMIRCASVFHFIKPLVVVFEPPDQEDGFLSGVKSIECSDWVSMAPGLRFLQIAVL